MALWGDSPIGARQLESLIEGLPLDGSLARSLDPERTGVGWNRDHDFMALIAELIDANTRLLFSVNVKKGTKLPDPIFIPRPQQNRVRDTSPKSVARLMHKLDVRVVKETNEET